MISKQGFEEGYTQRLIEGNISTRFSRLKPHRLRLSKLRPHGLRLSRLRPHRLNYFRLNPHRLMLSRLRPHRVTLSRLEVSGSEARGGGTTKLYTPL